MESGNVSAIISAASGISGVLLGNSFVAVKEWIVSRSRRRKDAVYLAIIVVSHLERVANRCFYVALDDGTARGEPAGKDGEYVATTTPPEFKPLDMDVEWKVLPQDLMYAILRLPDEQAQIDSRLWGIDEYDDDYPDHTEYFWVRQREYADLALRVSDLARRLRAYARLPPIVAPKPGEWHRDQELRDIIKRIDDQRDAYERRVAANPAIVLTTQ
ncbi:hypothetical protein C7410_109158 [Paraburkholderia silvatlantica]|uniref:Uncharacterized protein n=1 Tax=Paraburkholderia silvatlantica TaxID=321895 RepID=A0A2V4TWR4_9BURK|nr:hypothetical protein [Paraburkholderia silvatlantica]PYE22862.1 hypothetical protein C7410_109158 [Paraburkholderia silvatlantica]